MAPIGVIFFVLLIIYLGLFFFTRGTTDKNLVAMKGFLATIMFIVFGIVAAGAKVGFILMALIVLLAILIVGSHLDAYDRLLKKDQKQSPDVIDLSVVETRPDPTTVTPNSRQLPNTPIDQFCSNCGARLPLITQLGARCSNCDTPVPVTGQTNRL